MTIINIDRRGAGQSGGNAKDAYQGPKGRLDIEAALTYILAAERNCEIDASKIVIVGASNGTTSVLDYTLGRTNATLPDPAAIIWLSPGSDTEAQFKISANLNNMKAYPVLIIHPASEPWSKAHSNTSNAWRIVSLPKGQHGTNNFDQGRNEPIQVKEMSDWIKKYGN